jgi:hypothetical protein
VQSISPKVNNVQVKPADEYWYEDEDEEIEDNRNAHVGSRINMFRSTGRGTTPRVGQFNNTIISLEEIEFVRQGPNDRRLITKIFLEQFDESLISELGRNSEVKILEVSHIDDSGNVISDYSSVSPQRAEVSNSTQLISLRECKPIGCLPFEDDEHRAVENTLQIVVEEKLLNEEMVMENAEFLPDRLKEYLLVPVKPNLLMQQQITVAFYLRDEIVIVRGPVKSMCSKARYRQMLSNFILRNSARVIEDVVNKYSNTRQFRVCHMRVRDDNNARSEVSIFTNRKALSTNRFWVLAEDYFYFDQLTWGLSIARMDNKIRAKVYEAVASTYISYNDSAQIIYNFVRYENEVSLDCTLFDFDMLPTNHGTRQV